MESDAERIEKINKILFFFCVHESCNNELRRRQIIEIKIRRQRKILQTKTTGTKP